MRQTLIIFFLGVLLFSCKKDKVPKEEPCTNVELTGKRASVVGTWRWYKTLINQTDANGSTFTYNSTPATEGFNYYCVITSDGNYKGYKDSVLIDEIDMTSVILDHDDGLGSYGLVVFRNCGEELLDMTVFYGQTSIDDKLTFKEVPIYINDPVQKKYSSFNFFKRD